jgi:capsular polysaccharide biosynthesis protein
MTQCLLGIHLLDQTEECRGLPILLPRLKGFHQRSLALLGIDPARLLVARLNATYRVHRLYMADTMFAAGARKAPRQLRAMAEAIRARAEATTGTGASPAGRAIYVSRLDSTRRVMTNERALIAALEAIGIEHVSMGGRPMEEQIAIFAGASLVVAPHGAALTNLIFARPGAMLYELFPANYPQNCYRILAGQMDMAYQSDAFAVTLDKGHDSTWEVKVDAVAGRAAAMLSNLPG